MSITANQLNELGAESFAGRFGIDVVTVTEGRAICRLEIGPSHLTAEGYLHAGTVVALADMACGCGCLANLPDGAVSFLTIELKANLLGSAREGTISCEGRVAHQGRTTQVWDAEVVADATGNTIGLFRCTQLIVYAEHAR